MSSCFLADVGNSRIKCGHYDGQTLRAWTVLDSAVVPPIESWCETYSLDANAVRRTPWLVCGVSPKLRDRFSAGLAKLGFQVDLIDDYRRIPLAIDVPQPARVGIDRLLSAFAVVRRIAPGRSAAIISAGTAVTVDLVDAAGTFRGGVIWPGFRLMARALHEHTAMLPLVEHFDSSPTIPAKDTEAAINAGISAAIAGGIDRVVEMYRREQGSLWVYITGGDAGLVSKLASRPESVDNLVLLGLAALATNRT
jgi:type III pantothenate kinase